MTSKVKTVVKTREKLLNLFNNYLLCARGIDDHPPREDDYDELEDGVDAILEKLIFNKEK